MDDVLQNARNVVRDLTGSREVRGA